MICVYELYDLHSIFVNIRFSPDSAINHSVLRNIIRVLKHGEECDLFNQFRIAIQPTLEMDSEDLYNFSLTENKYTYFPLPFLKDPDIYQLLIESCEQLLQAVVERNSQKTFDLADCLHNLPIMLVENNYTVPSRFWKNEVKEYRLKWDKNFLVNEEKMLK